MASQYKPRTIRLTDLEYHFFKLMGGVGWLRHQLRAVNTKQLHKGQRNAEIRRRAAAGETDQQIADDLGIARTTVWRVRQ